MTVSLGMATILVPSYDAGITFFVDVLGFSLIEDTQLSPSKRWVVIGAGSGDFRLLLAEPTSDQQLAALGRQSGDRVFLFLHSDDFAADHQRLMDHGIEFLEQPRQEAYGQVAVFRDPFGNKWDLIQRRAP